MAKTSKPIGKSGSSKARSGKAATRVAKSAVRKTASAAPGARAKKPLKRAKPAASAASGTRPTARRPVARQQRFAASHLHATAFEQGLRSYAQYRDLGIKGATGGLVQAHVIRFLPPCRPEEVSKLHFHDVEFQMIYVLKGWIKSEFAGEGVHVFEAGSCWIQPPCIEHRVLDYSDDCEVLEIIMPADFDTVTLD